MVLIKTNHFCFVFFYNLIVTIQRVLSSLGVWFQLSLKYKHRLSRVFVWINEKDIWVLCNHAVTLWEPSLGFSCVTVHCACVRVCVRAKPVNRYWETMILASLGKSWWVDRAAKPQSGSIRISEQEALELIFFLQISGGKSFPWIYFLVLWRGRWQLERNNKRESIYFFIQCQG